MIPCFRAIALVLALGPVPALAQLLDVATVLNLAESRSKKVAIAQSLLLASNERRNQTKSLRYPSVELAANSSRQLESERIRGNTDKLQLNGSRSTLSFSQPILRPVIGAQLELDSVLIEKRTLELAQAKSDAQFAALQAVIAYLSAVESLALFEVQEVSLSHLVKQATRSYQMGIVTVTDSHEAQAKLDSLIAQRIAAERDVGVAWVAIQTMIGSHGSGIERSTLPSNVLPIQPLPEILAAARERNVRLRISELGVQGAALDIQRYKAVEMPTVDLVGSISRGKETSDNRFGVAEVSSTVKQVGVQLNVPLFSGFSGVYKDRELRHLYERASAERDDTELWLEEEIRSAYVRARSTEEQIRRLEQARVSQQKAETSIERGQSVGVRLWIDLLNARQQRFAIERDLARTQYDHELANARLRYLIDHPMY